jgi:hypothetical protein
MRCTLASACVGTDPATLLLTFDPAALCAAGYYGLLCGICQDGYFQSNGRCVSCGAPHQQTATLIITLLAAVAFLLLLSLALTLLHLKTLAASVHVFCAIQLVSLVGLQGVKDLALASDALTVVLTDFNFVSHASCVYAPLIWRLDTQTNTNERSSR